MTSKTLTLMTASLGLILTIGATTAAYAWNASFTGTRDQVRAACTSIGGEIIEGSTYYACFDDNSGTRISCDDHDRCEGVGPRLADFGARQRRSPAIVVTGTSLSESVDGGSYVAPRSTLSGTPSGGPVLGGGHIGNGNK